MALSILDGNQSATTLSTILTSGQHITAHTVVSLGTQAITDMRGAVSGSVVSISNFPASQIISGTVTANPTGTQTVAGTVTVGVLPALTNNTDFVGVGEQVAEGINNYGTIPIAADWYNASQGIGNLNVTATCVTSTNRIGVVTIGAGTVTIGAGTAQIGSVTASISGTVPISISSVTVGNSLTISSLPAISGTVTANVYSLPANFDALISNGLVLFNDNEGNFGVSVNYAEPITGTVTANTFAIQGTAVTTSNFTSTTASTVLANFNATREVLTIFNEGAGNLHICAGATCTTIAYQVRLSAGDYYEVPNHQTSITHSAVFATAGTARVTEVS